MIVFSTLDPNMGRVQISRPGDAWLRRRTPAGRWGRPEEVAGSVVFFSAAASDFVNGQILYVDGGLTSGRVTSR